MFGKVSKYFKEKGYGFIRGEDGVSYFAHVHNIQDGILEKDYLVDFTIIKDKNGRDQATNVIVIESDME